MAPHGAIGDVQLKVLLEHSGMENDIFIEENPDSLNNFLIGNMEQDNILALLEKSLGLLNYPLIPILDTL